MKLKDNEYQCAHCGEVYEKGWSEEEALKEANDIWTPEALDAGTAVICDDCFKEIV